MPDLLIQLLDIYIKKGDPPDILSIECPDDMLVIRLGWFGGNGIHFGYTKARWDAVWTRFNEFWDERRNAPWWAY